MSDFVHAALRLNHRYGLHITMAEYHRLSDQVRSLAGRKEKQPGVTVDEAGNVDAWVEFKGRLVCACIRAGDTRINTFLPPPPPRPDTPSEALHAQILALQHELEDARARLRADREPAEQAANRKYQKILTENREKISRQRGALQRIFDAVRGDYDYRFFEFEARKGLGMDVPRDAVAPPAKQALLDASQGK